jgi:hypothetical protein
MGEDIQVEEEVSVLSFETIIRLKEEAIEQSKVEIEAMIQKLDPKLREKARADIAGPMPKLRSYGKTIKHYIT